MSFLRIEALWALPLVLLPILIHLIHRRKHPTIPWAAMMFIGNAARTSRGGAKLRRWLILAIRTAVIAAILFAATRPLSSGMFGLAAGSVAATAPSIIVIDRSPSMQLRDASGETRQANALRKISATLATLGVQKILTIDSVAAEIRSLDRVEAISAPMSLRGADSTADVASMLRTVLRHLEEQDQQVADIWVCSDRQRGDWQLTSKSWKEIDEVAQRLGSGVRFHLSDFEGPTKGNFAIVVSRQRRIITATGVELSLSIEITSDDTESVTVPVEINVGGVTTLVDVEVTEMRGELIDYRLGVDAGNATISGHVAIPADINASDDCWYFSIPSEGNRPIGLVIEQESLPLEAASDVLGEIVLPAKSDLLQSMKGDEGLLDSVACLVWQGALPGGEVADELESFVERGGSVIFFPPIETNGSGSFKGIRWGDWMRDRMMQAKLDDWEFPVASHCFIDGDLLRRATVDGEKALAGKMRLGEGAVMFCGASVVDDDSLFVEDGLALFALLSETLEASRLYRSDQAAMTAGIETANVLRRETQFADRAEFVSTSTEQWGMLEAGHHAGLIAIHPDGVGEKQVIAINRSSAESTTESASKRELDVTASSLNWNHVQVGKSTSQSRDGFVREIWGAIWILVVVGMLLEASLTLPRRAGGSGR